MEKIASFSAYDIVIGFVSFKWSVLWVCCLLFLCICPAQTMTPMCMVPAIMISDSITPSLWACYYLW